MNITKKTASELPIISQLVKDYLSNQFDDTIINLPAPKMAHIATQIQNKKFDSAKRKVLVSALEKQHEHLSISKTTKDNIASLLNDNTYTVTTAHQLCLLTGPLYFIYKILSAIKLAQICKEQQPSKNFVPIYWMGSEDHDFEEINHFHFYHKTFTWEKEAVGAVGRLDNEGLDALFNELRDVLSENDTALVSEWQLFFSQYDNYGKGFQAFVNHLFGSYGLVVLNQDEALLKASFEPVMAKDLTNSLVETATTSSMKFMEENYHVQAAPRPVNLFYLKGDLRERIDREGGRFLINNTDLSFSEREILQELKDFPERFSPNVNLRPLYQESILPNVAFVGGPGEVAYWLPLKPAFEAANIPFPILLLRDMVMVLNKGVQKKINEWGWSIDKLFEDAHELTKEMVTDKSDVAMNLDKEEVALKELFEQIQQKAVQVDKNLEKSVAAELQKNINSLQNLTAKLIRAEKKNQEQLVNGIENLKDKLFPNNSFQERYDNFMPYYFKYGSTFFDTLLPHFNAFEASLKVVEE